MNFCSNESGSLKTGTTQITGNIPKIQEFQQKLETISLDYQKSSDFKTYYTATAPFQKYFTRVYCIDRLNKIRKKFQ